MINWLLISKILGSLLMLESMFMMVCLGVTFIYAENDTLPFALSIAITLAMGLWLHYRGMRADNNMSRKDAFLVVTLSWSVFSLFGSLPFMLGGYIPNFTNAYFETISGFTTTGATILDDVESLPHGILFWRSFTQWIGGLGIVFFTIAVLPSLVGGSVKVFAAEATGPIKSKLHPKLSTSAKSIWAIFLTLSLACFASYKLLGMGWFDSVNYAMTTIATGGFATHNDSIEFFQSPALEYVSTLFCFLSGINYILLYRAFIKGDFRNFFANSEFKFYCLIVLLFTILIASTLYVSNNYELERSIRCGLYQVVSFITTTGLLNDNAALWPHFTWIILAVCMFMGACAGSTSGGFKCVRCVMVVKVIANEFKQMLHPKAVLPLRFAGINVPMQRRVTLLAFVAVYMLLCLLCAFIMIASGIDNVNALTITISTLSNVGPTLGLEIGPMMSWNELSDFSKWVCSILMLMGRLEIFSVLIIFTPTFWKDR